MTLKEFYSEIQGDYDDVVRRLRREELVRKFVIKFAQDKSFESLCAAFEKNDGEAAFLAAHTMKGICQNLSFTRLYISSDRLTESLRSKEISPKSIELFQKVNDDYFNIIAVISNIGY